jgi:hypothetical protein
VQLQKASVQQPARLHAWNQRPSEGLLRDVNKTKIRDINLSATEFPSADVDGSVTLMVKFHTDS